MFRQLGQRLRSWLGGRDAPAATGIVPTVAPRTGMQPDELQALIAEAIRHHARGAREEALDCYELALAHAPDSAPARLGLARMLREAGEGAAALEQIQHALRIAPLNAENHFESALIHNRCGDVQGSIAAYERALELAPDHVAACANLGLMHLSQRGDPHTAQRYFERAVELDPSCVAAQANLGLALDEQGRTDAALAHYAKLIAAFPAESEYRWNRGLALLGSGDYARGWEDYEMRNARATGAAPRAFPFPVWQGAELRAGAALLVYGEQGLGDEIMFASCVPDLLARGISCMIECDSRLASLFARSFPAARVHGAARDGDRGWLARYPEVEAQIAIGSLPRLLRRGAADFPAGAGYLFADPRRVEHWRARLTGGGDAYYAGIAWRGGTAKTRRDLRSIPLREIAPLFGVRHVTFINLQRDAEEELAEITSAYSAQVANFAEALDDVDETTALVQALDGVVTADNSVAHIAGALGCKTWLMLPHHADWRWRRGTAASPWYPSLVLCRQAAPGDWASAVAQAKTELESLS